MRCFRQYFFLGCVAAFAGLIGSFPASSNADGLVPAQISSDAKWVMHVDFEALRESKVGEFIRTKLLSRGRTQKRLDAVLEHTGIDPRKDLISATLYDNEFQKRSGVILVEIKNLDAQKLLAHLTDKHPDARVSSYAGQNLYTWRARRKSAEGQFLTGSVYGDSTIVISNEAAKVMIALDVLDGKNAGLSESSSLAVAARDNAFLLIRGIEMAQAKLPIKCPVLTASDQLSLAIGQSENRLFVESSIITETADVASNAMTVVDGIRAMVALRHSEDAAIMRVVKGLQATATDTKLEMTWEADAGDVLKATEKMKKRHGNRREQWEKWKKKHQD